MGHQVSKLTDALLHRCRKATSSSPTSRLSRMSFLLPVSTASTFELLNSLDMFKVRLVAANGYDDFSQLLPLTARAITESLLVPFELWLWSYKPRRHGGWRCDSRRSHEQYDPSDLYLARVAKIGTLHPSAHFAQPMRAPTRSPAQLRCFHQAPSSLSPRPLRTNRPVFTSSLATLLTARPETDDSCLVHRLPRAAGSEPGPMQCSAEGVVYEVTWQERNVSCVQGTLNSSHIVDSR